MLRVRVTLAMGVIGAVSAYPAWAQRMTAGVRQDGGGECARRCAHEAKQRVEECVHNGGSSKACKAEGHTFFERCKEGCTPPPPANCEDSCVAQAERVFAGCLDSENPDDACRMRAEHFLHECLDERCPPPPDCEGRCTLHAHALGQLCVALGEREEVCTGRAREAFDRCVVERCDPPTCKEPCNERARHLYEECVATGATEEECAARARLFLQQCIAEHCPPPPCTQMCEEKAAAARAICLEVGGSEEECAAWARDFYAICVSHACPGACGGIAGVPCPEGQFCQFRPGTCAIADNQGICVPVPQACPDVWEPVCGCDGTTYGNACEAAIHGVSIDHPGECAQECDGGINLPPCDKGQLCFYAPGTCELDYKVGICVTISPTCPEVYFPVCGCDGITYDNRCFAILHGQSIDHNGPCGAPIVCGGIAGISCPDGQTCALPPGHCDTADLEGVCVPKPSACPRIYEPVCGCDGQTYSNACEALVAGVAIGHSGECEVHYCGGSTGLYPPGCREGSFCQSPAGQCFYSGDAAGICVRIPTVCPDVHAPVCGCDGVTYGNACEAAMAKASIDHAGSCDERRCGSGGVACTDGAFCATPPGMCGQETTMGWCAPRPDFCTMEWMPVCGCDDQTYSNMCSAASAGVSVKYPGQCHD